MAAFQGRTCSTCEWTEDREKLVGLWQDIPCLFYCSLHSYSNKHSKIPAFYTVGLHCQTPTLTHACLCREAVCTIFYDGLWYDPARGELTTYRARGGHATD